MFVLKHQDGEMQFSLLKGGFSFCEELLCISIETKNVDAEAFPERFLFALESFPMKDRLGTKEFEVMGNTEGNSPNVHVYTTFHSEKVKARLVVKWISEVRMQSELNVLSDDVDYYGDKAKPNEFLGKCELAIRGRENLWIPV